MTMREEYSAKTGEYLPQSEIDKLEVENEAEFKEQVWGKLNKCWTEFQVMQRRALWADHNARLSWVMQEIEKIMGDFK